MVDRYEQFLGSTPGTVVELIDSSGSPYLVRTEGGFEYYVSADDFREYYKPAGTPTPGKWRHFFTNAETGEIDSNKMAELVDLIHHFEEKFQDFEKARSFVKAAQAAEKTASGNFPAWTSSLAKSGWNIEVLEEKDLDLIEKFPKDILSLLDDDLCAVIPFPDLGQFPGAPEFMREDGQAGTKPREPKKKKEILVKGVKAGMKNVEMDLEGDILTLRVDMTQRFGPSKSGKTIIVASTEGNKSVPGRAEKIGLNIYEQENKRAAKGRKSSFKNVEMTIDNDILTITVDLSKEFGPSKSGKTVIIASTEGNQLVFGREEKIGLNVFRSAD